MNYKKQFLLLILCSIIFKPSFSASDTTAACHLLNTASYKTPFCQNQYQQFFKLASNVFNLNNSQVKPGQSLGGIIGIYQQTQDSENICYISCGVRQINGTPPDENTLFELASITKTFTGSILGLFEVQNRLNSLEAISNYLPKQTWLGQSYNLNENQANVTFQQLATFSGGVCFSNAPNVAIFSNNPNLNQSQFVQSINQLDPTQTQCSDGNKNVTSVYGNAQALPTHNFYSNSSVGLLAQALMQVDGFSNVFLNDFNGWMCNNITNTLNMTQTNGCLPNDAHAGKCVASTNADNPTCNTSQWQNAQYATGYSTNGNQFRPTAPFPFIPWAGAGALRSNAADMIKFIRANLGIATNDDPKQAALIQGMQRAQKMNFYWPAPAGKEAVINYGKQFPLTGGQGYGWVCEEINHDRVCGKIGGHKGFRSFIGLNNNKHYGIVLLFNTGSSNNLMAKQLGILSPSALGVAMIKNNQ